MRQRGFAPRRCSSLQDFAPFRTRARPGAPYRTLLHPAAEVPLIGSRLGYRADSAESVRGFHSISHPAASRRARPRAFFQMELPNANAGFFAALELIPAGFRTQSHTIAPYRTLSHNAAEVLQFGNRISDLLDVAALVRGFQMISHPAAPHSAPQSPVSDVPPIGITKKTRPRGFVMRWCSFLQDFAPFRTPPRLIAPYRTPPRKRFFMETPNRKREFACVGVWFPQDFAPARAVLRCVFAHCYWISHPVAPFRVLSRASRLIAPFRIPPRKCF